MKQVSRQTQTQTQRQFKLFLPTNYGGEIDRITYT